MILPDVILDDILMETRDRSHVAPNPAPDPAHILRRPDRSRVILDARPAHTMRCVLFLAADDDPMALAVSQGPWSCAYPLRPVRLPREVPTEHVSEAAHRSNQLSSNSATRPEHPQESSRPMP